MTRKFTAPWHAGAALAAVALFSSFSAAASSPLHKTAVLSTPRSAYHHDIGKPASSTVAPQRGRGPGIVGGKPVAAGINGSSFTKYGVGR